MKTWSDAEVQQLKQLYCKTANKELVERFKGKTWLAIYKKAKKLGLKRDPNIEFINRRRANVREKCNFWNGGIKTTAKGYRLVLQPGHPRADTKGYVMEHILVFENATGIAVPRCCSIHHINGVKDDNRIENLCMMTNGAHTTFHNNKRWNNE